MACPVGNRKYEFGSWKAVLRRHQQALEAYSIEIGRFGPLHDSMRHCHSFLTFLSTVQSHLVKACGCFILQCFTFCWVEL